MAIKLISVTKLNQNIMNGTRETGKYNDWRDNIKSENAIYNEIIENCKPQQITDHTDLNLQMVADNLGEKIEVLQSHLNQSSLRFEEYSDLDDRFKLMAMDSYMDDAEGFCNELSSRGYNDEFIADALADCYSKMELARGLVECYNDSVFQGGSK